MNNYKRSLLILALFCSFILILQFARMGVLNNAAKFENTVIKKPSAVSMYLPEAEPPLNAVIFMDPEDKVSFRCADNFSSLLTKYHIPFVLLDAGSDAPIPADANCLILTMTNLGTFSDYNNLFSFVKGGGSVIFASPPVMNASLQSLSGTMGITEYTGGNYSDYIVDYKGVVGPPGTSYHLKDMVLYSVSAHLRSVCDVYLEDESGNPLLWRITFGKGNIYFSNSNVISNLSGRGVVCAILAEIAGKSFLYPSYGITTSALESFPGPSIVGDYELFREYQMNYDSFAKNVLWVDLLKLTKDHGIIHTISFVQSYDSDTEAPFSEGSLLSTSLLTYGSEVLSNDGEIATHGFCYRPLGLKGELSEVSWFIPWPSLKDIAASLDLNYQFYHECFPSYTVRCYFPPEGRISENVLKHLREYMPGVKILCIPYHDNRGDQLYGDFQEDQYGFFRYSITSGVEGAAWNARNSLLSLGILSQSIDIPYAVTVNRVGWEEMFAELNDIYQDLSDQFPSVKPMKISDAAERIRWYEDMDFVYSEDDTGMDIAVSGYFDGICFQLRTRQAVPAAGDGYTAQKVQQGVYTICPSQPEFRIEWGN